MSKAAEGSFKLVRQQTLKLATRRTIYARKSYLQTVHRSRSFYLVVD